MLSGFDVQIVMRNGRFYIYSPEENTEIIENALNRLFGISGWAQTKNIGKTTDEVLSSCLEEGKKLYETGYKTFKIEARRTDKSFPLDSYELKCKCGDIICENIPGLKVDVHNPQAHIQIEIREKAYIYSNAKRGLCGLPVGTAGRGLLLLSGGIDSPVAGFLMAGRGMKIDAVHFHTYPYTSDEAKQKTINLAKIIGSYCMGIHLFMINLTGIQKRIKENSPMPWATVLLRMAMMECAEKIAGKNKCKSIITGESLSQVASQTIENLTCTQAHVSLPVLRPLIGLNKETIIKKAEQIGTYATSIEPYQDCCVLFNPPRPILHGNPAEALNLYKNLELETFIKEALNEYEEVWC